MNKRQRKKHDKKSGLWLLNKLYGAVASALVARGKLALMNKRQRKKAARKRYVIGCAGGVVVIYDTVTKETTFAMAQDVAPATEVALPTMQL